MFITILAGLGALITILALVMLFVSILPTIIAQFCVFKWSIKQTVNARKEAKLSKQEDKKEELL